MSMRQEDLVNTESREEGFITTQYTNKTETHSTEQDTDTFLWTDKFLIS